MKDSLKPVGEKIDLYTVLKRRKSSVKSFLIQNQIKNIDGLKRFEVDFVFSEKLLKEAKQFWQLIEKKPEVVPIEKSEEKRPEKLEPNDHHGDDVDGINKPGKRKKA